MATRRKSHVILVDGTPTETYQKKPEANKALKELLKAGATAEIVSVKDVPAKEA